jgi:hypothetical protein
LKNGREKSAAKKLAMKKKWWHKNLYDALAKNTLHF